MSWAFSILATGAVANAQVTVVNPLPAEQLASFHHLPEGGGVLPMALYPPLEVIDDTTGQPTGQTFAQRMSYYGFLVDDTYPLPIGFSAKRLTVVACESSDP